MQTPSSTGFLASLFDFGFNSFITTKLIKVLYVLAMVFNVIIALAVVGAGFGNGFFSGVMALVILAPLTFLFFTALARLWLELVIVLFRTVEYTRDTANNTREMADRAHTSARMAAGV